MNFDLQRITGIHKLSVDDYNRVDATTFGELRQLDHSPYYANKVFGHDDFAENAHQDNSIWSAIERFESLSPHLESRFDSDFRCIIWCDRTTGIKLKCRVAKLDEDQQIAVSIKRCYRVTEFQREIAENHYHLESAMILSGLAEITRTDMQRWTHWIMAIESHRPHPICFAPMSLRALDVGHRDMVRHLATARRCLDHNDWPMPVPPHEWEPEE